jgi:hypothetical protein
MEVLEAQSGQRDRLQSLGAIDDMADALEGDPVF